MNRPPIQSHVFTIRNKRTSKLHFVVEPWLDEYTLTPGQVAHIKTQEPELDNQFAIWCWDEDDYIQLYCENPVYVECDGQILEPNS